MKVLFNCIQPLIDVDTGYTKRFDISRFRPHVHRQGGERELGQPAARVTDQPGDRQRDQAAPIRSGRDSMIVKIINFSVFLSSIILPANCSLLNFCSKPQIH